MKSQKIFEVIADISYIAGAKSFFSGDSRLDTSEFICWAKEFEKKHQKTDWNNSDYILAIDGFTKDKLKTLGH